MRSANWPNPTKLTSSVFHNYITKAPNDGSEEVQLPRSDTPVAKPGDPTEILLVLLSILTIICFIAFGIYSS